ncbi:hypothetical protein L1887_37665 [Cichorium endivia]|nr:hypothetical protein L1887_37665 [Cichorium endivia]
MSPRFPIPNTNNRQPNFRWVFARFDTDNDGKILALELHGDGFIDFEDFMRLVKVKDERDDVKAAFEINGPPAVLQETQQQQLSTMDVEDQGSENTDDYDNEDEDDDKEEGGGYEIVAINISSMAAV